MIAYEFVCNKCGLDDERLCEVEERHNQVCEFCGGTLKLVFRTAPLGVIREKQNRRKEKISNQFNTKKKIQV